MTKRINAQRIKSNQSYTVEAAAEVVNVTEQTVRTWIKAGLPVLAAKRPMLILGFELRAFLQERAVKAKQPIGRDEFYCLRCRKSRKPYGMMADYVRIDANKGRLMALCSVCECTCSRLTTTANLPEISKYLDVAEVSKGKPIRTFQSPPKS